MQLISLWNTLLYEIFFFLLYEIKETIKISALNRKMRGLQALSELKGEEREKKKKRKTEASAEVRAHTTADTTHTYIYRERVRHVFTAA